MDIKTFGHQYSEVLAEAAFAKLGYFVYTNKSGKASSDLIVEDNEGFLYKVEVKSSSSIQESALGKYIEIQLKSVRSNKTSNVVHKFDNSKSDILAIVCTETSQVKLVQSSNIHSKSSYRVYLHDMQHLHENINIL